MLMSDMNVRHALVAAGLWPLREQLRIVDEWGNQIGLDGAIHAGMRIVTERGEST